MLKNHFHVAWRIISRKKLYALINVFSLALGICGCIVIWLVARYELGFDKFHPGGERIYRVGSGGNQAAEKLAIIPSPMPDAIRRTISGLENVTAFFPYIESPKITIPAAKDKPAVRFDNAVEGQDGMPCTIITDADWFSIFKYQWLAGSPGAALRQPFNVVLTENRARLYFGSVSPEAMIGKEVIYEDSLHVRVAGIVRDRQANTDLPFTDFISWATIDGSFLKKVRRLDNWAWMIAPGVRDWPTCFIKLAPGVNPEQVESQLPAVARQVRGTDALHPFPVQLQPLADIHFNTDYTLDYTRKAHLPTLYALMGIAAFILMLAAVNFINLSTAQSFQRAKEIGVRKVLGSGRASLILQFLTEAGILTALAVVLAALLVTPVMAFFSEYIPLGVRFEPFQPGNLLFLVGIAFGTTLLAGFYPAIVLAGYLPVESLKGPGFRKEGGRPWLRKGLIVFQFTISLIFIIAILVIGNQIRYMLSADYGFKSNAIVTVRTPITQDDTSGRIDVLAQRLKELPGVNDVIREGSPPIGSGGRVTAFQYFNGKESIELDAGYETGDEKYIPFYGMKLVTGRNYRISDSLPEVVINETMARRIGFSRPADAVGHFLEAGKGNPFPIVGVVADYHEGSFKDPIRPIVLYPSRSYWESCLGVRLASKGQGADNVKTTLAAMETAFSRLYPGEHFQYSFLDDSIARLYESEQKTASLVRTAMILAIFISCMGLFGLALFTAQRKTAEISIRKVLGATTADIMALLNKGFVGLVLLSFVIASPIAFWLTHRWLEEFAYRRPIDWWVFPLAGAGAILIALITVSSQSIRAAATNPVKGLRSE